MDEQREDGPSNAGGAEAKAAWYYAIAGKSYGPVSEEKLKALARQGTFQRDDFVYADYIGSWVRADSVYGLFEDIPGAPETPGGTGLLVSTPPMARPPGLEVESQYAGFWIRVLAVIIDWLVLALPNCLIAMVVQTLILGSPFSPPGFGPSPQTFGPSGPDLDTLLSFFLTIMAYNAVTVLAQTAVVWPYYAFMESSRWQATLGKRAVGIMVTDLDGTRISFARATGRYFASWLSGILCIGYIIAAFTERKQTLHDMIAGTLVYYGRTD